MPNGRYLLIPGVLAVLLGLPAAPPAFGVEPDSPARKPASATFEGLRPALANFARRLKRTLDREGIKKVSLGDFSGPASRTTNPGPGPNIDPASAPTTSASGPRCRP